MLRYIISKKDRKNPIFMGCGMVVVQKISLLNRNCVVLARLRQHGSQRERNGYIMSIFLAIFLGIVQGVTEFLPVSSSGHLSVLQNFFKVSATDDSHLLFDVMLHMGTFIAICFSFRSELRHIFKDAFALARGEASSAAPSPSVRLGFLIIIATVPLVIIIPFYNLLRTLFFQTGFIGFMLLITGALTLVSAKLLPPGRKTEKTMTVGDALIIGLAQLIAIIPGLSRAGATITVGLSRGVERDFSIRFSLLMSLPAVLGAMILTLIKAISNGIDWSILPAALVGLLFSAVVGVFAIAATRAIMKGDKWVRFSYYCFIVGVVVILLSIIL